MKVLSVVSWNASCAQRFLPLYTAVYSLIAFRWKIEVSSIARCKMKHISFVHNLLFSLESGWNTAGRKVWWKVPYGRLSIGRWKDLQLLQIALWSIHLLDRKTNKLVCRSENWNLIYNTKMFSNILILCWNDCVYARLYAKCTLKTVLLNRFIKKLDMNLVNLDARTFCNFLLLGQPVFFAKVRTPFRTIQTLPLLPFFVKSVNCMHVDRVTAKELKVSNAA